MNLEVRSEQAEAAKLVRKLRQNRIDGRCHSSTIPDAHDELGDGCDDQDARLLPDVVQGLVEGHERHAVDDLGILH